MLRLGHGAAFGSPAALLGFAECYERMAWLRFPIAEQFKMAITPVPCYSFKDETLWLRPGSGSIRYATWHEDLTTIAVYLDADESNKVEYYYYENGDYEIHSRHCERRVTARRFFHELGEALGEKIAAAWKEGMPEWRRIEREIHAPGFPAMMLYLHSV